MCNRIGCGKLARHGGLLECCAAHGGGRRCQQSGCGKAAQGTTDFCKRHGGGRRCQQSGGGTAARSATDYCSRHGGGRRCQQGDCTQAAVGATDLCRAHGERCKALRFHSDGSSEPCFRAGLLGSVSGLYLCAEHERLGLVAEPEARALIDTALPGRPAPLPTGSLSLWNGLGAKDGGLGQLNADELAAVLRACEGELQRRCTEQPNNLSRCRNELSKTLTQSAVEMQTAPADVDAERTATRVVLNKVFPGYGWGNLGRPTAQPTRQRSCPCSS